MVLNVSVYVVKHLMGVVFTKHVSPSSHMTTQRYVALWNRKIYLLAVEVEAEPELILQRFVCV